MHLDVRDVRLEHGRNVDLWKLVMSERDQETCLTTRAVTNDNQFTASFP